MTVIKKICFDFDGVIAITKGSDYENSRPNFQSIKLINKLYEKNYKIIIYTARFMGRNNDSLKKSLKSAKLITLKQLKKWNVKYSKVFFGKPSFDILIDDKCLSFKKKWIFDLKKKLNL